MFDMEEIELFQKQISSVVTKQISGIQSSDIKELVNVLDPLTEMSGSKQKQILSIVSNCVKEFINYVFIIFDKTIIQFILDKTEKEISK